MSNREGMVKVTDATERITHWILAGSCLFCVLTGLGFMFHHWEIISTLLGGYYAMKWMHIFSGVVFALSLGMASIMWWKDVVFAEGDAGWIMQGGGYLWEAPNLPPVGMFNAGQKLFFWFVFYFGIAIIVSGLIMWNPLIFPVSMARTAYMVHGLSAFVIAAFFVVHLYLGTIGNPGTVQIMFTGWCTRAYAEEHKPKWLEERAHLPE